MSEIGRRAVHASGIAFPTLYLVGLVTWEELRVLLVLGSIVAVGLEIGRLRVGLDWWIYERLTRSYEADSVAGYALYMFGVTAVALAFPPHVAVPAMLMLMLGDPISGLLSSGELKRVKGALPVVAMFVISLALALPFALGEIPEAGWAILAAAVGAGLATGADAVKPVIRGHVVDDNLTIPIAAAIGLWVAYSTLPPGF